MLGPAEKEKVKFIDFIPVKPKRNTFVFRFEVLWIILGIPKNKYSFCAYDNNKISHIYKTIDSFWNNYCAPTDSYTTASAIFGW